MEHTKSLRTGSMKKELKKYFPFYMFLLPAIILVILFCYMPMEGLMIAFKDYKMARGIEGSEWVGLKHFQALFSDPNFYRVLGNTLKISIFTLLTTFPITIIFTILVNEILNTKFKSVVQTITYMPHFLSWVIIYSLALQLFAPGEGLVNMAIERLGGSSIPFLNDAAHWVGTYIGVGVWQNFGWGSIVYLAAIAGINSELYEAASVDGAGRFRKMWNITLPGIKPTIVVLLIMNLGNILGSNFDRPFAFQNNLVMNVADVISTYVYRTGIKGLQFSLTTAVGLFQSVVGVLFLLMANWLSRKLGERGIW